MNMNKLARINTIQVTNLGEADNYRRGNNNKDRKRERREGETHKDWQRNQTRKHRLMTT